MSQITSEAAAQPAANPQTSAVENQTSDNVSSSQLRQALIKSDLAAKAPPVENVITQAATPAATPAENPPASDSVTAEPTTTDTPQTTEAQPVEAMPDSVLSNLSSLDPETRKWVEKAVEEFKSNQQEQIDKRIGKERAKRGDSERIAEQALSEVQRLRAELAQNQQPVTPTANSTSPLAQVQDLNSLATKRNEAVNAIGAVDDALAQFPSAEKISIEGTEYDRATLIDIRRNARDLLTKAIPERQAFLQQRAQANQNAITSFPYLADQGSPEYAIAQRFVRENNHWLQHQPNALEIVAKMVEGEKAMTARRTAQPVAIKPAVTLQRPSSDQTATTVGSAPERISADGKSKKQLEAIQQKVSESSNVTGSQLRQILKQTEQLRNSR